jgi:phosphoenolpyruvate carboxylase
MKLHTRSVGEDVDYLGSLLGSIFEARTSRDAFETVERVRHESIDYRSGERESRERVEEVLGGLDPSTENVVARAFTSYFELINLAEERQRIRSIRTASQEGTLGETLADAVAELKAAGAGDAVVQAILEDVLVVPTFTAHPTEARRKTVKSKLRAIAEALAVLDESSLTDLERKQVKRTVEAEVTSLWASAQLRGRRPEPTDEARNVQWYLEEVLFEVTGEVYDELGAALAAEFDVSVPKLFEFRSWAGSDRDGNPYVTPDVTEETLQRQRAVVLSRYRDALKRLSGTLSQDGGRLSLTPEFEARLDADRERLPAVADTAAERYPEEPYRQKLRLMRERLDRVGDVRPGGYNSAAELLADVGAIDADLRANGASVVADAHVEPLRRQVDTFGFRLAGLDLRDHRENHTQAIAEVLAGEGIDYRALDESERTELLTDAMRQDDPVIDLGVGAREALSESAARVLELFDRLGEWQREYGTDAIDTYCISMTEEASHVLEVCFLADQAGVLDLEGHSGLDVVPLLETEHALAEADSILRTLLGNEAYSRVLDARGSVQEVMIGYSDSSKENGFLAANWDLHCTQRRLAGVTDAHGVTLRLFHGRGGSISRGGGPMNEALLALPTETVTGQVKFTEQGESIAEKYANPRIAERELETMLDAQLRARHRALGHESGVGDGDGDGNEELPGEWREAMDRMAEAAREEYHDLLSTEGFVAYFEQATPITVIEELNLGSRPASRSGERTVEDLRAIPWVFAWTQSRCIITGWYALATGIDAYLQDGDVETLQEMYEEWPFFRATLDNAALALARTDVEIAAEYAAMADPELRERFFDRLCAEYDRGVELVTEITGREHLVERGWLRESLRRRNPYVDPLNLLQVRLLDADDLDAERERTLRLTVKGIAAGMKNTG